MSVDEVGRDELPDAPAERPPENSATGSRLGVKGRRAGVWALRLVMVGLAAAAGIWAYSANLRSGRPAMDMGMRVTSGATPFPVVVASVERGPISGTVTYTGSVVPFDEEDIYPRVTGRIIDMPVYPGDVVRAGQVVARLDDVELASRLREADAILTTTQANREQMEADLTAAQHGVFQMEKELAVVEAEVTYVRGVVARTERLYGTGAVSRQEYESDRSMAAQAEARRAAARAKLDQSRAMEASAGKRLLAAESMVAQSRAALRTAQVVRDYVTILAPGPGSVVKRLVAPGVLVQPGIAILKIARVDRVRLQANVGEKDLGSIAIGSPVTVTSVGTGHLATDARVTSVFPYVDQGSRTAVVEAVVDNPGRRLVPGQYVTMRFVIGARSHALLVPVEAVIRLGGKASLWVVEDGRAAPRPVTTGLQGPDRVEIAGGLAGSERIVVRGHEGLYAGARVHEVSVLGAVPAAPGPDGSKEMPKAKDISGPATPGPGTPEGGRHADH